MNGNRNFSFEKNYLNNIQWMRGSNGGIIVPDTINFIEGNQSWLMTTSPFSQYFNTYIFQYFNLTKPINELSVSIWAKTEILDNAWLKVALLNEDENLMVQDSVSIVSQGKWSEYSVKSSYANTCKVYIEIQAKSKDTIILDDKMKQKLWIDNLKLKLNGKPNNLFYTPIKKLKEKQVQDSIDNHLTLKIDTIEINKIEDFKKHQIIALGESIHGSKELQSFVFETIRSMISAGNCKLVLLELPFEIGLRIDDYVTGETEEDIQNLLMHFNYDIKELLKLLSWIRDFNKHERSKVHLSGFDINHSFLLEDHLLAFLKNQKKHSAELNNIIELLKQAKYNKAMVTFNHDRTLYSSLSHAKYESIIRALKYRNGLLFPTPSLVEGDREYIQFQNAKFAIDCYLKDEDKAIIYAHLGHLNKRNSSYSRLSTPCLGNYMDKQYHSNYFVTALLAGKGTIFSNDSLFRPNKLKIQDPEQGSIEQLCMRSLDSIFYKNLNGVASTQSYRTIGISPLKNQFFPLNHKGRFDAFVFFRNSHAY